jgi:hypothetical protein
MSLKSRIHLAAVAAVALLGGAASGPAAAAQAASDLSAFAGKWQINLQKTRMGREGPNGRNIARDPTFTWIFAPEGQGLRMDVYEKYPQPAPTRTMTLTADAIEHGCRSAGSCLTTGGSGKDQTYRYWQMDEHMLARLFYVKGKVDEYSTYAVSTDGRTLSIVSWSPGTPEWQNIQVFDKLP